MKREIRNSAKNWIFSFECTLKLFVNFGHKSRFLWKIFHNCSEFFVSHLTSYCAFGWFSWNFWWDRIINVSFNLHNNWNVSLEKVIKMVIGTCMERVQVLLQVSQIFTFNLSTIFFKFTTFWRLKWKILKEKTRLTHLWVFAESLYFELQSLD